MKLLIEKNGKQVEIDIVKSSNLEDAKNLYMDFLSDVDDIKNKTTGKLTENDGTLIGYFSPNGKLWDGEYWVSNTEVKEIEIINFLSENLRLEETDIKELYYYYFSEYLELVSIQKKISNLKNKTEIEEAILMLIEDFNEKIKSEIKYVSINIHIKTTSFSYHSNDEILDMFIHKEDKEKALKELYNLKTRITEDNYKMAQQKNLMIYYFNTNDKFVLTKIKKIFEKYDNKEVRNIIEKNKEKEEERKTEIRKKLGFVENSNIQGGFSDELWKEMIKNKEFKEYIESKILFGYIGHYCRTKLLDKKLEETIKEISIIKKINKKDMIKILNDFVISRLGRSCVDDLSENKYFTEEIDKSVIEEYIKGLKNVKKINSKI